MELDQTDLKILVNAVRSKITKFDETWGDATWRRANRVDTKLDFYKVQTQAREQAGELLERLTAEQNTKG